MAKNSNTGSNLFYPDTRFERLARRSGGVERDAALERAQAAVNDLKSDFSVWIDNEFATLNGALKVVDGDPTNKAALERAFHSCAQLRDVSGTMGYELVTFVARTLCDILEVSTPERSCIGAPERICINDSGKKAPELGAFS